MKNIPTLTFIILFEEMSSQYLLYAPDPEIPQYDRQLATDAKIRLYNGGPFLRKTYNLEIFLYRMLWRQALNDLLHKKPTLLVHATPHLQKTRPIWRIWCNTRVS